MMTKILLAILLSLTWPSFAQQNDLDDQSDSADVAKAEAPSSPQRQCKTWSVHAGFGAGFFDASVAHHLTGDLLAEFQIRKFRYSKDDKKVRMLIPSAGIEYFVSQSFYLSGALSMRHSQGSGEFGISKEDPDPYLTYDSDEGSVPIADVVDYVAYRDVGSTFGIGNRWQWKHFNLGFEALSFYVPIHHISHKTEYTEDADNKKDAKEFFDTHIDTKNHSATLGLFSLNFGYAF